VADISSGVTSTALAGIAPYSGAKAFLDQVTRVAALGRIGEAADTAGVVAFLASADAGCVTGQVIYGAGGQRGPIPLDR
jgi:NAD(P)-dependent dehydrogenase (short-subunit alcohol dehydrogenase family)